LLFFFSVNILFIDKKKKLKMRHQLNSLEKMKIIMNYDASLTFSENVLKEQNQPNFSGYDIFKPNYVPDPNDPKLDMDIHDWFTVVQVALLVAGFATGGATSIVAFALQAVVDLVEAGVFIHEGDPYMGVLIAILGLVGADELMRIPGLRELIQRRGIEGIKDLIKKNKDGIELGYQEIKDLKLLKEKINENVELVKKLFGIGVKKRFLSFLSKKDTKYLMNVLLALRKTKLPILVAGTWIPFDYLYIYVFKDDIEKMQLRDKNVFLGIVRWVGEKLGGKEVPKEDLLKNIDDYTVNDYNDLPSGVNYDSLNNAAMKSLGIK
jgi:hypothetical protein